MLPAYLGVNGIFDILGATVHYSPMADEPDPRVITPIPKPLLAAIDDYRFAARLPSRAEAIRRLIEIGLKAAAEAQEPARDAG
jgi:hypothetical protein